MDKDIIRFEFRDGKPGNENLTNVTCDLLRLLSATALPSPSMIEFVDQDKKIISGFLDPGIPAYVEHIVKNNKQGFSLINAEEDFVVSISPFSREYVLLLRIPVSPQEQEKITALRELFHKVSSFLQPDIGRCYLAHANLNIRQKHFEWESRTGYFTFFGWLTYFGKRELYRQGGKEILLSLPHSVTAPVGEGVLIEIGNDPFDANTPEGEELIVRATRALPPVVKD